MPQQQNNVMISDPLNPSNNVGKSAFRFGQIKQVFNNMYHYAFVGCFCKCHHLKNVFAEPKTPSSGLNSFGE